MNIALLTTEDQTEIIVEAIRATRGCKVNTIWADRPERLSVLQSSVPEAAVLKELDDIWKHESIDTLVIVGATPQLADFAGQFARAGHRVLIPVVASVDAKKVFDYTVVWQDAPGRVLPLLMSGVESAAREALENFDSREYGKMWRLDFERRIVRPDGSTSLDAEIIQRTFLQDIGWITSIAPGCTHVTALTTGPDAAAPLEVLVTLTGERALEVRWTLKAADSQDWTLSLIGEKGQVDRHMGPTGTASTDICSDQGVVADLEGQLKAILHGSPKTDWQSLIQMGEYGATMTRALAKRRTLPVHFEEASERSQFKSQMAAIGCGVLLWTMFGVIGMLMLGSILDPRDREYKISSSAGFVLRDDDFQSGHAELSQQGTTRLNTIQRQWSASSPVVIIADDTPASADRLTTVLTLLQQAGIRDPDTRVVLRKIPSGWYERFMSIGWVIVFLPLGLILIAQLLLGVSRPVNSASRQGQSA